MSDRSPGDLFKDGRSAAWEWAEEQSQEKLKQVWCHRSELEEAAKENALAVYSVLYPENAEDRGKASEFWNARPDGQFALSREKDPALLYLKGFVREILDFCERSGLGA